MTMDIQEEVLYAVRRKRAILFSKNSECLQSLSVLLSVTDRRAVTLWALDLAQCSAESLTDSKASVAKEAVDQSRRWAKGQIKMTQAKRAILACHQASKTASAENAAAFHAIGQACSTVHSVKHALGFPIYDLTALVRRHSAEGCEELLRERIAEYVEKLLYWRDHGNEQTEWADFLEK